MKNYVVYALMIITACAFSYTCWRVGRQINYQLSYEDMVRRTVNEMVKPEALR